MARSGWNCAFGDQDDAAAATNPASDFAVRNCGTPGVVCDHVMSKTRFHRALAIGMKSGLPPTELPLSNSPTGRAPLRAHRTGRRTGGASPSIRGIRICSGTSGSSMRTAGPRGNSQRRRAISTFRPGRVMDGGSITPPGKEARSTSGASRRRAGR